MAAEKLTTEQADIRELDVKLSFNNEKLGNIEKALITLIEFMHKSEERHVIEQERRDEHVKWKSKIEKRIEDLEEVQNKRSWVVPALTAICMALLGSALTYIGVK